MKNRVVTRSAFARASNEDMIKNRQAEFVISSEAVDTFNTVFKLDGWDLKRYASNPIVCYQHKRNSDNPDDVIGTSEVFIEGDKLIGRVTFEDAETNPKAEKIFRKVQNGTLKMASISANVRKAKYDEDRDVVNFTESELIEWSIVSAGSNPEALKRNEDFLTEIRQELKPNSTPKTKSVREAQVLINNNK